MDNGVFAHTVQKHIENIQDNGGGLFVNHKRVFVVGVFDISISGKGADVLTVPALHIKHLAYLVRGFRTVVFVENTLDWNGDAPHILRFSVAVQRLVIQRDKADIVPGEPVVQIIALITVVSERTCKVFHDHTVYTPPLNVSQHPLEIIPLVIRCAGNTVVHILVNNNILVTVIKSGNMIFNNLPLVCYAFGLVKTTRILFRKSDIDCNSPYPEFCFNSFSNSPASPCHDSLLPYHITPIL